MIKKLILTMLLISSTLQAGDLFSKLPYGIELGKKVPYKVEKIMEQNFSRFYDVIGKFEITFTSEDSLLVEGIAFNSNSTKTYNTFPKKLKKAGFKLCDSYNKGTSYKTVKNIITKNKGYDIEEYMGSNSKIIEFKIDNDKEFILFFGVEARDNCKGGLYFLGVTLAKAEDDDY